MNLYKTPFKRDFRWTLQHVQYVHKHLVDRRQNWICMKPWLNFRFGIVKCLQSWRSKAAKMVIMFVSSRILTDITKIKTGCESATTLLIIIITYSLWLNKFEENNILIPSSVIHFPKSLSWKLIWLAMVTGLTAVLPSPGRGVTEWKDRAQYGGEASSSRPIPVTFWLLG